MCVRSHCVRVVCVRVRILMAADVYNSARHRINIALTGRVSRSGPGRLITHVFCVAVVYGRQADNDAVDDGTRSPRHNVLHVRVRDWGLSGIDDDTTARIDGNSTDLLFGSHWRGRALPLRRPNATATRQGGVS